MVDIYLYLLIGICFILIGWGIIRLERVYQYPFFMGSIFASFVLPQAIALYNNPAAVDPTALEKVLLMGCLCAAMCWFGYQSSPNIKWLNKLDISIDERKLFKAGIALVFMGYFFELMLSRTNIQLAENGNWTGPATIYLFFSKVLYIAFAIFLLQVLKYPSISNFAFTVIAGLPLLETVIFAGRRQATMTFLIIVGLSFWFVRRYILPRWTFILLVIASIYIIPLIGILRGEFWNLVFSNNWQLLSHYAQSALSSVLQGNILELRNAALLIDAAEKTGQYGYGTGFWNDVVFQYVPGQIIGYDFKESLQIRWGAGNSTLRELYGYAVPSGTTTTGIGDSFVEFGYFGCLIFAGIGYIFRQLWLSSVYQQSVVSRLLYISLISPAMVGITHGIGRFIQEAIFQATFVGLVALYCKHSYQYSYQNRLKEDG